ncbi:transcriptional regulator ATRX homolog isoform X1 [Anopheles darlingi]|uniref:transcriptional regulator ATRX homolog isoform X1 n=1 Tax=Anopheles darlingi TaxID=43151 RepID=UPI00210023A9|nr:transcriptional regulator ATRX homolog isoform X1 [Anopheles darlingi]
MQSIVNGGSVGGNSENNQQTASGIQQQPKHEDEIMPMSKDRLANDFDSIRNSIEINPLESAKTDVTTDCPPDSEEGGNNGGNDDGGESSSGQDHQQIRLVSLDKLLRTSLIETLDEQQEGEEDDVLFVSSSNSSSRRRGRDRQVKKANASIIEINSSDTSDSDCFIGPPSNTSPRSKRNPSKTPRRISSKPAQSSPIHNSQSSPTVYQTRDFTVVVEKLPTDLRSIESLYGVTVHDLNDKRIERFLSNTNYFGDLKRTKALVSNQTKPTKPANGDKARAKKRMLSESDSEKPAKSKTESDSAKQAKSAGSESDSDKPLKSRKKSNIPKTKMARNAKKRRAVSDSEEEEWCDAENTGKTGDDSPPPESAVATNGGSDTNDEEAKVDDDGGNDSAPSASTTGRSRRAATRSCRTNLRTGLTSDEDGDEAKDDFQTRKKRTRVRKNSSSSDEKKPAKPKVTKRRRIKKNSSDSEADSPNKGRKNIRKLMKKKDLDETTKNAEQVERERKQRVAERQKLYNQEAYDEKPEQIRPLEKLVLDFDEETAEALLEMDKRLVKQLKPHQANGIKFMFDACCESLERLRETAGSGCILAHCMGLGKSLQVVALSHTLLSNADITGIERILVVCPLSTVRNWVNEFKIWLKHVEKGSRVEVYEISRYKDNVTRANRLMEWHNEGGVMILGYDMFRNLANPTAPRLRKKVRESLQTSLIDPGPDMIVCDEGHLLKNEKTSLSKAITRIKTMRRIVLTGTPIQNNMKEYYCMVQFVKPQLLGTYTEYMNRFVNPITNGQYTDSTPYDIQLMRKRAHVLHKLLDGCVQRRDYSVLAPFLPPKLEFVVSVQLTPMQIALYKYYMEHFAGKRHEDLMQKRSSMLFSDFQNLQRIWTHPRVLRYNSDRYEINQQKKRDLDSDAESLGSMKDFLDDSDSEQSTSSESSSSESDDDVKVLDNDSESNAGSVESSKTNEKPASSEGPSAAKTTGRRTRKNGIVEEEPPELSKPENPTEWWMQLCPESELDNLEHSGKLMLLMEILKECEAIGDKLLVFSQSLYSLDVIEHFLSLLDDNAQKDEDEQDEILSKYPCSWSLGLDYFRLDGSTSIDNRNDACKVFNDENNTRARLFLISTRAGGLGINLVAANRVVIFDVSWNPSHDIQSIFRVYRFGQTKPCYIYRFIAMGTMEEKIYERQVTKQAISKRVIDEQQIDRHYKENDLQELYRYDVEPSEPRPTPNLPKDRLFAELLQRFDKLIYKYHEHDSLLENKEEETLNEEERKAAWEEFEQEKNRPPVPAYGMGMANMGMGMGMGVGMAGRVAGPVTSSSTYGIRNDVLLKLLNMKARQDNPTLSDNVVNSMIPYMMQELYRQMNEGDLTFYKSLLELQLRLEVPSANMQQQGIRFAMPANAGMVGQTVPQPMMMNAAGNVASTATQFGNMQMQGPGHSGMPQPGMMIPNATGVQPTTLPRPLNIDPEIVELD